MGLFVRGTFLISAHYQCEADSDASNFIGGRTPGGNVSFVDWLWVGNDGEDLGGDGDCMEYVTLLEVSLVDEDLPDKSLMTVQNIAIVWLGWEM